MTSTWRPLPNADFRALEVHSRGYLPHWRVRGAIYFVTWRTADSLPAPVVARLRDERQRMLDELRTNGREPTVVELAELNRQFGLRVDARLDSGYGSCPMRNPELADLVAGATLFNVKSRYDPPANFNTPGVIL